MKIVILILTVGLIGCSRSLNEKISTVSESRVQVVEWVEIDGVSYRIIQVDSSEFLTINSDAVVRL